MIRDIDIATTLATIERELLYIKSAQKMGGDSLILYRYNDEVTLDTSQKYLVFTVSTDLRAVVKASGEPFGLFDMWPVGIRTFNNIYFFPLPKTTSGTASYRYGIASTQPGEITITSTPPSV